MSKCARLDAPQKNVQGSTPPRSTRGTWGVARAELSAGGGARSPSHQLLGESSEETMEETPAETWHKVRRTCWHRGAGAQRKGSEAAEGDGQSGGIARGPSRASSQRAGPRPRRAQGEHRAGQREYAPSRWKSR